MTRKEFIKALEKALKKIKKSERKNYLNHYDELISDLIESGMTEQEAIEKQGSVRTIAAEIMENIEPDKLVRRDKILIGLIVIDVIFVGVNLWHMFLQSLVGVTISFGQGASTIGIIGGADGPTSVFVAGTISPWQNGRFVILIVLLIVTILYIIVKAKQKPR